MAEALIIIPKVDKRYSTAGIAALSAILPVLGAEYIRLYAWEHGRHNVTVIYEDLETDTSIYDVLDKVDPETIVGISIASLSYGNSVLIMEYAHARGLRVAVGGPHVQIGWKLILRHRPYVICAPSHGETAMVALLEQKPLARVPGIIYVENGIIRENDAIPISYEDLPLINGRIDHEPFFRRWQGAKDIYKRADAKGFVSIRGIKGCAKKSPCTFCTVDRMEPYDPLKRAQRIVMEREDAIQRFGETIFIRECNDDLPNTECLQALAKLTSREYATPTYNNARITDLLREGYPELVRHAGYTDLLLGLESFGKAGLKYTGKSVNTLRELHMLLRHTESSGLNFYISGILGWPGETPRTYEEIQKNIEDLLKYDHVKSIGLGFLILYPFTALFNLLMNDPVSRKKHLKKKGADILDYFELFQDWLYRFAGGINFAWLDSFMHHLTQAHPRVIYLSGFAVRDEQTAIWGARHDVSGD